MGKVREPKKWMNRVQRANIAIENNVKMKEVCVIDGNLITVMIFKGTNVCSENCRKVRDNDHEPARALNP